MQATARIFTAGCVTFLLHLLFPVDALANTFIVNTGNDVVDSNACDTGHCSLREAILAAEQNVGEDTILFDGDYVIAPLALLPVISEKLTIDGSGHSVTLDGSAYLSTHGITCPPQSLGDRSHPGLAFYQANNSMVTGLTIRRWCNGITVEETDGGVWTENRFSANLGNAQLDFLNSDYNLTVGNLFWQDPVNPLPTSGDQVELQGSSWNHFRGNVFTGGENAYEIIFGSNFNVIEQEEIELFFRGGIEIFGSVQGNVIRDNTIRNGVPLIVDGVSLLRGLRNGIGLGWGAVDNVIEDNHISGVLDSGIALYFMVDPAATSDRNIIRRNTVSHAAEAGIMVGGGSHNYLSGNLISSVGGIGIDLSDQQTDVEGLGFPLAVSFADGVTDNHSGLAANRGQNYPVMDEVESRWNQKLVLLKGTLQMDDLGSNRRYEVECFANSSPVREAEVFLGSRSVVVAPAGSTNLTMPVQTDGLFNEAFDPIYVSCTATDSDGNTSELSDPIRLQHETQHSLSISLARRGSSLLFVPAIQR